MKQATVTRPCRYQGTLRERGEVITDHDIADKLVRLGFATRDADELAAIASELERAEELEADATDAGADNGDQDAGESPSEPAAPAPTGRRRGGTTQEG